MTKLFVFICCVFYTLSGVAGPVQGMRVNTAFQTYIEKYKDIAIQQMREYKIPASITLAQGLLESGAGRSELATKSNNHFGIKCHGWTGRKSYHDDDASNECFRAYNSANESFVDHSKFLSQNRRYSSLFELSSNDYKGWAKGLKACGYATSPVYAQKLIDIIELYRLYEYDNEAGTSRKHHHQQHQQQPVAPRQNTDNRVVAVNNTNALHVINAYNNNYFLRVRKGDTFASLSQEVGVSASKLAKYNERDKRDVLSEGEVIFLKKKQKHADHRFKNQPHIVKPGESMYMISQMYGIQLKELYKKNNLSPDYQIKVGDRIRIY